MRDQVGEDYIQQPPQNTQLRHLLKWWFKLRVAGLLLRLDGALSGLSNKAWKLRASVPGEYQFLDDHQASRQRAKKRKIRAA